MDNSEQKQFLSSLSRAHINQLCLEMQQIITNLKVFLAESHGYTDAELTKIMTGKKYEELGISVDRHPPTHNGNQAFASERIENSKIRDHFTQPNPQDLAKLKKEDENVRRSLMFELEWCVNQVEQGNFPY